MHFSRERAKRERESEREKEREREREREDKEEEESLFKADAVNEEEEEEGLKEEEEESLLTLHKRLKVGEHRALSGNTTVTHWSERLHSTRVQAKA